MTRIVRIVVLLAAPAVLFTALVGGLALPAKAATLMGVVEDARTGAPVRAAVVVLAESGHGTETDTSGRFELTRIPPGRYTVCVSRIGFRDVVKDDVVLVQAGHTELRIVLKAEVIPLGELEVVAEPVGAADIHRMPSFVTVLKQEAFEGRVTSVPEVLSSSAGVQVREMGGLGTFSTISIRGSSAEQVEVYLDGILLNSALGGGVNLSSLPLAQVSQIELYRGAAADGEGIGGSVHIRTQTAGEARRLGGSGSWGSFDSRGLNAMVSGSRERTDYLVMVDYSASDNDFRFLDDNGTEYNSNDDAFADRQNSDFISGSVLGKWGHRLKDSWRIYIQENLYWKRQGIPGISNNQSQKVRFNTFRSLSELGVLIPDWLGRFSVRQRVIFTHTAESFVDRLAEVGVARQDNRYRTRTVGWSSRLQAVLAEQHAAAVRLSFKRETFLPEERLQQNARLLESGRWTGSGKLGADWTLPGNRGVISGSVGLNHHRSRLHEWNSVGVSRLGSGSVDQQTLLNLRVGLRLDLTSILWLKANVGRGKRAPTFFELFGDRGGVAGNTKLLPEKALTWDAGFRVESKAGAVLEWVYFDHRYDNLIQFIQNSQGVSRASNIGRAHVRGMEAALGLAAFERWTWSVSYTYQNARDRSRVSYQRDRRLPNRATHGAHGHTDVSLGRWRFFYGYTFEDGNFVDRANLRPVPARHIHNVGVGFAVYRDIRATVEGKNLRNSQVADLWGYPLPGRSYFLMVEEDF